MKMRTNKKENRMSNYITSLIVRNEDISKDFFVSFFHVNRNSTSVESNNKELLEEEKKIDTYK